VRSLQTIVKEGFTSHNDCVPLRQVRGREKWDVAICDHGRENERSRAHANLSETLVVSCANEHHRVMYWELAFFFFSKK
jgi:hypothetical protein